MIKIGSHIKSDKNLLTMLNYAKNINADAIQIFHGSPRSLLFELKKDYNDEEIREIKGFIKANKLFIVIHSAYLINLATNNKRLFYLGAKNLIEDLRFANKIGIFGVVVHFGSKTDRNENEAINNMVRGIEFVLEKVQGKAKVILETSSGGGNYIGKTIENIKKIYDKIDKKYKKRICFCIDTAHIFTSGYDISKLGAFTEYMERFKKEIGIPCLIHLNDSKTPFGKTQDKHAALMEGYIFDKAKDGNPEVLEEILKVAIKNNIPIILETDGIYKVEINYLRELIKNHKLLEKTLKGGTNQSHSQYHPTKKIIFSSCEKTVNYPNKVLIDIFSKMGQFNRALGIEVKFVAYKNIVSILRFLPKIRSSDELKDYEGIGEKLLRKTDEILATGKLLELENFEKDKQLSSIVELQNIMGFGPKKAREFVVDKKINSIEELKKKEDEFKLTDIQKLGIKFYDDLNRKMSYDCVKSYMNYLIDITKNTDVEIIPVGSFRMGLLNTKDIDVLITNKKLKTKADFIKADFTNNFIEFLRSVPDIDLIQIDRGDFEFTGLIKHKDDKYYRHIDIRFTPYQHLATYMLYFGSGEKFSRKIRQIAKDKGYKLNELYLENLKTNERIIPKTEEEIFKILEIEYVEPERRILF
jgi:apurinic endonuclease APN1